MRPALFLLLAVLTCARAFAAFAPDSAAGRVFVFGTGHVTTRHTAWHTIILCSDGRFTTLWTVHSYFVENLHGVVAIGGDGEYTYTKTGAPSAVLDLVYDNGNEAHHELTFTSATGGNSSASIYEFTLTKATNLKSATALNVSTRGIVRPGHPMIVGFIVPNPPAGSESGRRRVLVRAVGPSLAGYGVSDVWEDPDFLILKQGSTPSPNSLPSRHGDWTTISYYGYRNYVTTEDAPESKAAFLKLFDYVGAFSLIDDSKDAVGVFSLSPGPHTVVAQTAPGDPGGEALVEVYFLP